MKAKPKKDRVYQSLPNGLRRNVSYDGRLMTNKDFIDTLILKDGFIFLTKNNLQSGQVYVLENSVGRKFRFKNKSEKEYIDTLMDKILEGAKVEMEHKGTIEAIKKPGIKTKDAAAMIAADHIAEKKDYYDELDKAKLEDGGPIQDLSKGTTLQGPSHAQGGIEIQVNAKPVAEAEGGEVVINKKSSKLFCEELSEINQKGGGKALNCNTCEHKDTCEHSMAKGGGIPAVNPISQADDISQPDEGDILADGGEIKDPTKTQTILFDKNIYSLDHAKDWLYKHNYSNSTLVDETENNYRFRQQEPSLFDKNSFRTITLADGIKAVIGKQKLEQGGSIKNQKEIKMNHKYNIGDQVLYKDVNGEFTLKSKIKSILPANTVSGQPYPEYTLEAGGAYTADELRPVMDIKKEINAPMNLNKPTNWEQLPEIWKLVKKPTPIAFDNTPYDKGLQKLMQPFVGTDQLRPIMSGVYFGKEAIVATDAHKLIALPFPNKEYNGVYNVFQKTYIDKETLKGDLIEGKFPEYERVIPEENPEVYSISALKLKTFLMAIDNGKYYNGTTHQVLLTRSKNDNGEYDYIGVNAEFMLQALNMFLMLGKENLFLGMSLFSRAIIISDKKEVAKAPRKYIGKEIIALVMPVIPLNYSELPNGMFQAAEDQDWDKEFKIAYYLPDDSIINNDGSVAKFDFNLTKTSNTDLTETQDKMVNAYMSKNNAIPILDGVAIKNSTLYATDLENFLVINNIKKQDGVYYYTNNALVESQGKEVDDYPTIWDLSQFKNLGTINRLEFLYNVEKCNLCVGDDDLRPVMKGIHLFKDKDANDLIIEATNGHVLFRNQIKNHTIEPSIDAIIPATKKLKVFLQNIDDQNIEVYISGTNIMFKTPNATVASRLIEGKYVNTAAVIPHSSEKTLIYDIKNLKDCIKSISKEEKKQKAYIVFNSIKNGKCIIDLHNSGYSGSGSSKIRQLCEVDSSEKNEKKNNYTRFGFLGMPVISVKETGEFSILVNILETFIKITESDKLVIDFTSSVKPLMLSDSEFKQIAEPVNLPKPAPKPSKPKDEIEVIAQMQDVAEKKKNSKQAVKKAIANNSQLHKIKVAKAKAAAQKQRIRILALK